MLSIPQPDRVRESLGGPSGRGAGSPLAWNNTATTAGGLATSEFPGRHGRTVIQWAEGSWRQLGRWITFVATRSTNAASCSTNTPSFVPQQHLLDLFAGVDVDEVQGFVPQKQGCPGEKGARQVDLFLFPVAQVFHAPVENATAHPEDSHDLAKADSSRFASVSRSRKNPELHWGCW